MATFPVTVPAPTSRSYNPGTYPSTDFESLDGTKTHIRYGNRRVNATLTLGFSNITDVEAATILLNYEAINSVWDEVTFNNTNVVKGAASELESFFVERTELKWRYAGPPTVQSVYPGISNVSCSFVACLDSP